LAVVGGPGSRKGSIVDDLVTAYNLTHICTEDILYQELPKKLASVAKIENVSGMKDVLEVSFMRGDNIVNILLPRPCWSML